MTYFWNYQIYVSVCVFPISEKIEVELSRESSAFPNTFSFIFCSISFGKCLM